VEISKDVEFDGKNYRISRMTAKTGSGILGQLLPKLIPFLDGNGLSTVAIINMLPTIEEDVYSRIQDNCLAVTSKYEENGAVTPVFLKPNIWAVKELEYDGPAVLALMTHALIFNLAPFFVGGGLQKILASVADLTLLNSQA
jgi:hypothetical protein